MKVDSVGEMSGLASDSPGMFKTLFDATSYPLLLVDISSGRIVDANRSFATTTGWARDEICGAELSSICGLEKEGGLDELLSLAEKSGEVSATAFLRGARVNLTITFIGTKEARLALCAFQKPHEVFGAEQAVEIAKNSLEQVAGSIGVGMAIISRDYHVLWMNGFLRKFFSDSGNRYCYEIFNKRSDVCPGCGAVNIFERNVDKATYEQAHTDINGEGMWVEVIASPIRDENGTTVAALEMIIPITERKRAEEELKRSEEALRRSEAGLKAAQRIAHIGNWDWNISTGDLLWSDEIYRIFGLEPQQFGATYNAFLTTVHEDDRQYVTDSVNRALTDNIHYSIDHRIVLPDGSIRVVHEQAEVVRDADGTAVRMIGTVQDVTESRAKDKELVRLATAIEQAHESVIITDKNGIIQYVNPAFEKSTGYGKDEAIGKTPNLVKSGLHGGDFYKSLWDTISSGKVWSSHIKNKTKANKIFEEEITITPVFSATGEIINYIGVQRNITKEARLERQLRQTQKMQAMGTLAGGVAHDFNNILTSIIGFAELAGESVEKDTEIYDDLQEVLKAGQRAKDIIRQILTFCRETERELQPIELHAIVKESLKLIRASIPTTIEIRENITKQDDVVMADPTQMTQVIMNLCANAEYAMREHGGVLAISLENVFVDEEYASTAGALHKGAYLKLSISDTGHGMDSATMERIFDPFFTTKPRGDGTGLGLSVVHGIVTTHGGAVKVYSEPAQGTTFHIYFPKVLNQEMPGAEERAAEPKHGSGRILYVDDEQSIVRMGTRMLEKLGYKVAPVTSSREALQLFKASPNDFDLVLTDQTMPGITGIELAKAIKTIRPETPIVICTGINSALLTEKSNEAGVDELLGKPFTKQALSETVKRTIFKGKS